MDVGLIGGAGHVGLPLGLVLTDSGFNVHLIDSDQKRLQTISGGELPFKEPGGKPLLEDALDHNRLHLTTSLDILQECDIVICIIGTPIDEHHNPQVDPLLELMEDVTDYLNDDQLLILRSTVYPGTTAIIRDMLEENGFSVGEDIFLTFAPERIAQHHALEEIVQLPQLVGAFDDESYRRAKDFFRSFVEAEVLHLNPAEAELGKLFTNMWRYLTFAAANEFYLIAESFSPYHDININRILDKTSHDYPRFDVPSPGANVGGPCLTKDGWFLVDNIPFNELVSAAYQINEGMPAQILDRMSKMAPDPEKIAILGMAFKPNSDDTRNSVAYKMKKQLLMKGFSNIVCVEPNVEDPEFDDLDAIADSDWVILMTPHDEFSSLETIRSHVKNDECLFCDIWGKWEDMKHVSNNGYFFDYEVETRDTAVLAEEVLQ